MFWIDHGDRNYYLYINRVPVMRVSWQPERGQWRRQRFGDFGRVESVRHFDSWNEPAGVLNE